MNTPNTRQSRAQSPTAINLVLYLIASLAGAAALWTGGSYGAERAGALGLAIGLASAIGCLFSPKLLVHSLQQRDITRSIAAALLFAISAAFALSGALGAAAAARDAAARTETKRTDDHKRLQADYDRASAELARLPMTRPAAVIEEELAAVLRDSRLNNCEGWLANVGLRAVCIQKVEPARKQLANAQARERISADLRHASEALAALTAGKPVSADAAALSRLAGRLGLVVAPETIVDGLLVLTILAVELLGGLALALVRNTSETAGIGHGKFRDQPSPPEPVRPSYPLKSMVDSADSADLRRSAIVEKLKLGALEGRQSDLADALGIPKTTLRRIVDSEPALRLRPLPGGVSRLELR